MSNSTPPTEKAVAVLVPMTVDVWINYAQPQMPFEDEDNNGLRAYVASIPKPDFGAIKQESGLLSHDCFEHLRNRPLFSNGDPERQTFARSGIYVTWTLPRMYRTGLTASSGVKDFDQVRQLGGYPKPTDQNASQGTPIFREVPSTWIVCRSIAPSDSGSIRGHKPSNAGGWTEEIVPTQGGRDYFIIQSNVVRRLADVMTPEDIENVTSPFIDPDLGPSQAGASVLGHTTTAADWTGDADQWDSTIKAPSTVPITVVRSANPFFADFQPLNASVFSMFDDLSTYNGYQLCDVKVSYTIMGYHRDWATDPLYGPIDGQSACDRLKACQLQCDLQNYQYQNSPKTSVTGDDLLDTDGTNQKNTYGSLRTFCHGSMFDINFSQVTGKNDLLKYPGDEIQQEFVTSHPLSVGTNTMDALFGWLRAQDTDQSNLVAELMKLQTYVLDSNDDLDSQLQAEDLIATNNFIPIPGETEWHFAQPDKQPTDVDANSAPATPSPGDAGNLLTLNNWQSALDTTYRARDALKQQMFDLWWKCAVGQKTFTTVMWSAMQDERNRLRRMLDSYLTDNVTGINTLTTQIEQLVTSMNATTPVQATAGASFYIQQDPTVLISGTTSGWPQNFNDDLDVRLSGQTVLNDQSAEFPEIEVELRSTFEHKVSSSTYNAVTSIVEEAITLQEGLTYSSIPPLKPPLYHPGQDQFDGKNGWFPLFIEWEVEYYHIPFDKWDFMPCGPESRYGWCLQDDFDASQLSDGQQDYRVLSGRVPLLPQAASTLESTLRQVFSKINPEQLDTIMDLTTRTSLLAEVRTLEYLSAPMSGLFDQLITRRQGAHFQPITYSEGDNKPAVVSEAKDVGNRIGMTDQDFLDMDSGCATTPIASLTDIPSDASRFSPFKACTHGQFRFTKFNIVDRYGQMVDGVRAYMDQNGNRSMTPLFPCLGEAYSVQEVSGKPTRANTVIQREDGLNSFVQLPPSINQHARINARFVAQEGGFWRRIQEWENPVRGWLVIDYANTSIQIYSPDGVFVQEYSIVSATINTKPFPPDSTASDKLDPVMSAFLARFLAPGYLLRLFQNITRAIDATQASPSHYAESMLSVLGKPLALVTFGCSIELSKPPLVSQQLPSSGAANDDLVTGYDMQVKLGDKDNIFDGLLGIFKSLDSGNFDFDNFQCYHDPDVSKQPQLQPLRPLYVDPTTFPGYIATIDSSLSVSAALVDPFTPVHIYSAILPIKTLSIPPWCLSIGLSRISSFFKTGPTLLANDVPAFASSQEITRDYSLDSTNIPNITGSVAIPAVSMGDWRWLQPYWVEETDPQQQSNGATRYNLMGVEPPSQTPLWEPPPCVITEGYLQMAKPFAALQQSAKEATAGQS